MNISYSALPGDLLEMTVRFLGHRPVALGPRAAQLSWDTPRSPTGYVGLSVSAEPLVAYHNLEARNRSGLCRDQSKR